MPQVQSPGGPPPRKFSDTEIDLLVKQAGERERVAIQQANVQVEAKMLDQPLIVDARVETLVRHAEERTRLEIQQSNEKIALAESHAAARSALVKKHALEGA